MRRSLFVAVCSATAVVLALSPAVAAGAKPSPGSRLTNVSLGDPFAACTIGADTYGGFDYPAAQVEPSVAVDPHNPERVVTAYQQDRWSDGGAKGLAISWTADGRTFHQSTLPFSSCAPGGASYERASDPWVSTGPDGAVYASGIAFDGSSPRSAVLAATSTDGGATWVNLTPVIADNDPNVFNDKNSVTADPTRPGYAYQVWNRYSYTSPGGTQQFDGPSYISITHDGGRTWSLARPFVDTSAVPNTQTLGNLIVVDPRTGTLNCFFNRLTYPDASANIPTAANYEVVSSTDAGQTWSAPRAVARDTSVPEVDPNAPTDASKALRAGAQVVSAALDPSNGTQYVAYEGSDFTGGAHDSIELVRSTDGGFTWSAPTLVNRRPDAPAFLPSIAVDRHHNVALTYYDLRYLRPGNTTTLPTAAWLITFKGGNLSPAAEQQISGVFDWLRAPYAESGHFLGDYQGLAMDGTQVRAVLVLPDPSAAQNLTDVFTGTFPM